LLGPCFLPPPFLGKVFKIDLFDAYSASGTSYVTMINSGSTYLSGGLERADIGQAVCNILEGGNEAFRERARRLRVQLGR
jgi:hypothetical protein